VPHVIMELLGTKLVAPPPLAEDIPSPPTVEGEVVEGCPVVVCAPSPQVVSAKSAALGAGLTTPLIGRPI
jgi:hypothetical protein